MNAIGRFGNIHLKPLLFKVVIFLKNSLKFFNVSYFNQNVQKVSQFERQNLIGGYYTEKYIAKILVKRSLIQWFSDCLIIQEITPLNNSLSYDDNHFLKITQEQRITLNQKLKNTKILDPAVGAGVFLIESAKFLEKIYQFIQGKSNEQETLRLSIVKNHLFGWDIKNIAIETTKNELAKWIMGEKPTYYESYNDLELNLEKAKIWERY